MSLGSKNKGSHEQGRLAERKPILWLRARTVQALRRFFIERGYLEVETPYLIPAPTPECHIEPIRAGHAFLHTSPELCMKRLLAAGYPSIFQICPCFRQDERGERHLPQFTLLEWYRVGADYFDLMEECEEMVLFVAHELGFGERLGYRGNPVSFQRPWQRISVNEAFARYASISMKDALESGRFDLIMVEEIEPRLGTLQPTFLYDYPSSLAALARLRPDNPQWAERFELYVAGLELANAFSELTDVGEQRKRFEREKERRLQSGKESYPLPERFLQALHFMPPSAGIALGVDRLVMLFADQATIDQVVSFTPEEL
ncbi:MAG: EF-P lysine aminoacylase EpmA [Pseudomonadota bacterium]